MIVDSYKLYQKLTPTKVAESDVVRNISLVPGNTDLANVFSSIPANKDHKEPFVLTGKASNKYTFVVLPQGYINCQT